MNECCPICRALTYPRTAFCDEHIAHLLVCRVCGQTARVIEGLCGDCSERDAALDWPLDVPIGMEITEQGYAALEVSRCP